MAVVINEMEVLEQPAAAPAPPAAAAESPAPDEQWLLALLAREAWRLERRQTD
ncbi:hypothetical protein [Paucibacter sp. M5-1]|uniref:hypothetical protein n=1 Tax=Paucibacter sp. M5-1 TaxID=3015998 RepID=UPI0022B8F352|nr:hypothetical protein [Paucibacter sp. M5-1]MCZ7884692.1 hypothetical protein [Paucibacter sp. M5-1]